jgi:hypothetical protein
MAEAGMALKTMSISKLMDLRQKVDAALASKVAEERRALQSRLSNLGRMDRRSHRVAEAASGARSRPNTATRKIPKRHGLGADSSHGGLQPG